MLTLKTPHPQDLPESSASAAPKKTNLLQRSAEKLIRIPFSNWSKLFVFAAGMIGFLGLIGWLANVPGLAQIIGYSVLIPLRAALLFFLTGTAFFLYLLKPAAQERRYLLMFVGVANILYSLVNRFPFPFALPAIEPMLLRNLNVWEYIYRDRMSPLDVQAFVALGLALFLLTFVTPRRKVLGNVVGALGVVLAVVHGIVLLGYTYGTPLFYPEGFKPSSFPSGVAFFAMGLALIAAAGRTHFPMRYLSGDAVRVQLLRTFLPIGVASILVYSLLLHTVFRSLNPALTASLSAFLATVVVVLLVIQSSQVVSLSIERAVRRSEEQIGGFVESLKEYAIFMLDPDGYVMTWSEGAQRIKGYKAEEIIGEHFSIFYPAEDQKRGKPAMILKHALTHGSYQEQGWRVRKNGALFWADALITAIYDNTGALRGFTKVVRDMTDRKKAEESLIQKSAFIQMLQTVSSSANEASTLGEAMQASLDEVCQHTGWPMGHALIVSPDGTTLASAYWHHNSDSRFLNFERDSRSMVFRAGMGLPGQVLESGKPAWITDMTLNKNFPRSKVAAAEGIKASCAFPILSGKQVVGVLEFFCGQAVEPDQALLDVMGHIGTQLGRVAERQTAHAVTSSSLREKEVLLKEIHHRVKNNLQIISSLLRLQASKVEDAPTLAMLQESQNRVQSMALIHESLYQSPDLAHIPIAVYVNDLVSGLTRSYGIEPGAPHISVEVDPIRLDLDTAIPCGLIMTELVSNAFKYAFTQKDVPGRLVVAFHQPTPGSYLLRVKDNGVGFPAHIEIEKSTSLGLRLVRALTRQLGGQMQLNRDSGTEFQIAFSKI